MRIALSGLENPLDAQAQEKWYHDHCFVHAERTRKSYVIDDTDMLSRHLCDCEIVVYVSESLCNHEVLTLNHIHDMYLAALVERGIEYDIDEGSSNKYKKHLRSLLSRDIPDIEFRQPPARNKSAFVALKSIVSKMVDTTAKSKIDSPAMYDLCKTLRYEVMQFRDWNFTGDFSSWENPPVLEYVIKQIMLGPNYIKLDKQRIRLMLRRV